MSPRTLAPHLLVHLYDSHMAGERRTVDDLVALMAVRRADVRRTLSAMHEADLYDVVHGRLTLKGFIAAARYEGRALPELREVPITRRAFAA